MRESKVEARLYDLVKARGGQCIKIVPTRSGLPDRLVVHSSGAYFVELKTKGGVVSELQKAQHTRLREQGQSVSTLWSVPQVEAWVRENLR